MSGDGNGASAIERRFTAPAANSGRTASPARGRPFQPGRSGNPRGRPKRDMDLAELARVHTREAIGVLVHVMQDAEAPAPARIAAASVLLDRGWGKAPQALDMRHQFDFTAEFEAFVRTLSGGSRGEQ
jgi:hypothetical protein